MSWYAVDALGDASDETKEFLWPFDARQWLKLAVIVFFAGGGGGFGSMMNNAGSWNQPGAGPGMGDGTGAGYAEFERAVSEALNDPEVVRLIAAVAVVFFVVLLLFQYLSSVFSFVFYRVVDDEDVRIRAPFREHAVDGAKYMVFQLLVLGVVLGGFVAVAAAFFADPGLGFGLLLAVILLWLLVSVVALFVHTLALPTMVREDAGFVEALHVTGGRVRAEWKQALVFLLANVVVSIAAGVVVAVGLVLSIIALAIPLVVLGVLLSLVSETLVLIPMLLGVVGLLVAWFLFAVPAQTYVYRWVLDVHAGFADLD
ncbi:MAG: hypothetical protein ACLFMT_01665 [Halobacteriales archaeon]